MAEPLPPDASRDAIQEELEFLHVMIESLDPGAYNYMNELTDLERQKAEYQRRLEDIDDGGGLGDGEGYTHMSMDGNNDFWEATMGGRPGSGQRTSSGSGGSLWVPQNGLKRSLQDGGQYPSKRPTPDPSNATTPTSSTDSFELIDHPNRPQPSQHSREQARQRQLQYEAAFKRQRESQLADEQYARQLSELAEQSRSASSSSSRPNVQTTLSHNGNFSRPAPPPTPARTPSQDPRMRQPPQSHGHPSTMVKPEPASSKQQHYSSPLTTRLKNVTNVVDLTASDSDDDDDDIAEVAPSAFSPNHRRHLPSNGIIHQNRPPFDTNRSPQRPPQPRAPAVQPTRSSMPGSWPNATQVPSSDNGYVYNQTRPDWLQNSNQMPASSLVQSAYNGVRSIAGGLQEKMDDLSQLSGLLYSSNSRNSYGGLPQDSNLQNRGVGGYYGSSRSQYEDDEDDDVIFGGVRPLGPGQMLGRGQPPLPPGVPAGYGNQETYRRRFDEMMSQSPAQTMEEINALMENIRPDEDTPEHLRVKTPEEMNIELHKYQELGLTWLQRCEDGSHKGGILADDMGLGKTIQMLSLIVTHKSEDPRCKTTLIVAPVALMRQWRQEIETRIKPRYRLSVYVHHGPSRKKNFSDLRHFDIVLTTFGTLTAELKKLEAFKLRKRFDPAAHPRCPSEKCALLSDDAKWYRVVLDEAQCIKNNNTQGAKAACRLNTLYRFCMTGTPMMNNVDELWSLIHFLRIKPYCERHHFQREFTKRLKTAYSRDEAMKSLQALIRSIMLRRTKQSKFEGRPILVLPERTTYVDNPVFSEDEQAFYKALEDRSQLQFNKYLKNGTVGSSYSAILVLLLRLRQACCHPHLIKDFGVSAAAGVSPETLIDLAKKLDPGVVERIKATGGNFECPVCYDACPNPAIFVPCGHDTCQECFAKIADNAARNGDGGGGAGNAKCPNCRGEINSKQITDFESFKKVHMPDQLTEEEQAELQRMQEEFEDSETENEDSDSDSDAEEEVDANGDIAGFVVGDDVEDSETASEAEEEIKAEEADEDGVDGVTRKAPKQGKGKGKEKVEKAEKAKKSKKSTKTKKGKEKKKEKKERKRGQVPMTLAEYKKQATRSQKGRRAYIKKLSEDWVTSAKIEKTMETLKEIMENPKGEKVLIFSQWTSLLDLLECPIYREGWGYRRYDGSMNAAMRGDAVDEFRDVNNDVRIMLVSLKAGNAGLNLNMASQVIILDPFWNP